jgi:phytoene synthase
MNDAYEHCEALVRERDRARFLATLFAPADKRPHLFALYAFDLEIAHIPDAVREPMAGEIRLQWWREALRGERAEEAQANPVAAAILDTIERCGLSADALVETIDARQFDLLGQPMESRVALEKYLDATSGNVVEHAARILDQSPDAKVAARHAGRAIGLTRAFRDFPRDVSKGRLFVPLDLLAAHEVHTASVWAGESSGGLRAALMELQQDAKRELDALRALDLNPSILAAFLPATLAPLFLARMEKTGYNPFRTELDVSRLRSQFALWRAARSGKI